MAVHKYTKADGATVYLAVYFGADGRRHPEEVRTVPAKMPRPDGRLAPTPKAEHDRAIAEARALAALRRSQVRNGEWKPPEVAPESLKLHRLIDRFVREHRPRGGSAYYEQPAAVWKRLLPDKPVAQLTVADVERFKRAREDEAGPSTVRKNLTALGTFFRWAKRRGHVSHNPADPEAVSRPPEPPHRTEYLTLDQEVALLATCPAPASLSQDASAGDATMHPHVEALAAFFRLSCDTLKTSPRELATWDGCPASGEQLKHWAAGENLDAVVRVLETVLWLERQHKARGLLAESGPMLETTASVAMLAADVTRAIFEGRPVGEPRDDIAAYLAPLPDEFLRDARRSLERVPGVVSRLARDQERDQDAAKADWLAGIDDLTKKKCSQGASRPEAPRVRHSQNEMPRRFQSADPIVQPADSCLFDLANAGLRLGLAAETVRSEIRAGRLRGTRVGRRLLVHRDELAEYAREARERKR